MEFHLEELQENELQEVLKNASSERKKRKKLLKLLHLTRIGFYPHDAQNYVVFDYTFGDDVTNYLLVVGMNNADKVEFITMES